MAVRVWEEGPPDFMKDGCQYCVDWCKDHPRFYTEDFLKYRRHSKVKVIHFFGLSMAVFMLTWGLFGKNIRPNNALLLAFLLDQLPNILSLLLIERTSPKVILITCKQPLAVFVAEVRLWFEVLVNKYDVWPHFGDLDNRD